MSDCAVPSVSRTGSAVALTAAIDIIQRLSTNALQVAISAVTVDPATPAYGVTARIIRMTQDKKEG